MQVEQAAKAMSVFVLIVGVLVVGMGVGTTAGVVVVGDGCNFQPGGVNTVGASEPPACQEHAEQLSMWADCMFLSGFGLLVTGLGGLLYLQYQTEQPEPTEGAA